MTTTCSTSSKNARIAVVIVHYKTPGMLKDCLETLAPQLDPAQDVIIIVDNNSGKEHLDSLKECVNASTRQFANSLLVLSPDNLGFAGANNLAITIARARLRPEYFLLLNPDTLLRPNAIGTLLQFLHENPKAAAVGPRLEDPDGTPQQSAFGAITPVAELIRGAAIGPISKLLKRFEVYGSIHDQPHQTHWLAGACVLMRSSLLDQIGLLDDRYFMYFEEVDFFRRAAKLSRRGHEDLEIWYQPAAHVVHLVGRSSGVIRSQNAAEQKRLPPYWFESRHRYFRKNFGYLGMLAADSLWLAGHCLNVVRKTLTGVSHATIAQSETKDLLRHSAQNLLHPRSLT